MDPRRANSHGVVFLKYHIFQWQKSNSWEMDWHAWKINIFQKNEKQFDQK